MMTKYLILASALLLASPLAAQEEAKDTLTVALAACQRERVNQHEWREGWEACADLIAKRESAERDEAETSLQREKAALDAAVKDLK